MAKLSAGKLHPALLNGLCALFASRDKRLVCGPAIGEDAAVIDLGDRYLVTATDPVTFAVDNIGWYAVNVNANDLAVRGVKPQWFQAVVLLPGTTATSSLARKIFTQIARSCEQLNVTVTGGHTEVTPGLPRPMIVGSMIGESSKKHLVTTAGARPGDDIVITKGIVIEGTALLARERAQDLSTRGYSPAWIKSAQNYLFSPGISVLQEALLACSTVKVHAMHDPTEGGLANGLFEVACASGTGLELDFDRVPILPHARELCREFKLNPFGTLTSGTLIITLSPAETPRLLQAYNRRGIIAERIGRLTPNPRELQFSYQGKIKALSYSHRDEILKALKV